MATTSKENILRFVKEVSDSLTNKITYKSSISHEGIVTKIEAVPLSNDYIATTRFVFIDDEDEFIYHLYILLGNRIIYHDSRVWHRLEDGNYSD